MVRVYDVCRYNLCTYVQIYGGFALSDNSNFISSTGVDFFTNVE